MSGIKMPRILAKEFEELDEKYDGWNNLVRDMKKRQQVLKRFGANGVVGYQDIARFQNRFNSLDPLFVARERRVGSTAIAFNGFIIDRVDESGLSSVEIKSSSSDSDELVESAKCDVHVYHLKVPTIEVPVKLLSLKVIDIDSEDEGGMREYLQDPSSDMYIPTANLLER